MPCAASAGVPYHLIDTPFPTDDRNRIASTPPRTTLLRFLPRRLARDPPSHCLRCRAVWFSRKNMCCCFQILMQLPAQTVQQIARRTAHRYRTGGAWRGPVTGRHNGTLSLARTRSSAARQTARQDHFPLGPFTRSHQPNLNTACMHACTCQLRSGHTPAVSRSSQTPVGCAWPERPGITVKIRARMSGFNSRNSARAHFSSELMCHLFATSVDLFGAHFNNPGAFSGDESLTH